MDTLEKRVLTMNRGSSTLKAALYGIKNKKNNKDTGNQPAGSDERADDAQLLLSMTVDSTSEAGTARSRLKITDPGGTTLLDSLFDPEQLDAPLEAMLEWLGKHGFLYQLAATGHRLVQGGPLYKDPQRITPEFMTEIEQLIPLDPDHMPAAIQGLKFIATKFPDLPQVACFDTAFHRSLPKVARMYALPRRLCDQGILRYGFHGLSYEYIVGELRSLEEKLVNGRVIVAHLGSGASIVALRDGKSIDTSMGFTPLEGLVMSTRSGDVDPGALLYLLQHNMMSAEEMATLLNKESGLLGVSGTSGDMRALLEKIPLDTPAAEAVDLFCYRVKKYIGAYAAVLGGLDMLIFAGGIGEHAPLVRQQICEDLEFLGVQVDAQRNAANAAVISHPEGRVRVRIIETNEELMIVRHVVSALGWANG
jgi:acetate kinase